MAFKRGTNKGETISGTAAGDQLFGLGGNDTLIGSGGNDFFVGGSGNDVMRGGAGSDFFGSLSISQLNNLSLSELRAVAIREGAGDDKMFGDGGSDFFVGEPGADTIVGGAGRDTLVYTLSNKGVSVNLTTGIGTGGYAQGDRISGIEFLSGSLVADTLTASQSGSSLDGSNGADRLFGGQGKDSLDGGSGNDRLAGGFGGDVLDGGAGADTFVWQSRADTLVAFESCDFVRDFSGAQGDIIDLRAIPEHITSVNFVQDASWKWINFTVDISGFSEIHWIRFNLSSDISLGSVLFD